MLGIENITVHYGEFQVLDDLCLEVHEGELVVLIGPNGHGKSTLMKAICGLLTPSIGRIHYKQDDITNTPSQKRVEMGITYIAEDRHLFPEMTVQKNLKLGAYNKNARKDEAKNLKYVFELFPRLKERTHQLASTLSGGEARMLAIARGLMSNAELLAIDEPSLGLAPNLRVEVFNAIRKVHDQGLTILVVEQSIPEICESANRIYLMEEGRITFSGGIEEAKNNPKLKEAFLGM